MAPRTATAFNKTELRDVVPGAQAQTTLAISNGAITPVSGSHIVAAQTGTADDLETITFAAIPVGGSLSGSAANAFRPGDVFELTPDAGDTITIKHNVGNILTVTGQDIVLDTQSKSARFKVNAAGTGVVATLISGVTPILPNAQNATELAIASGAATPSRETHILVSETGSSDDLTTITATAFPSGGEGAFIIKTGHTITAKNSGGNITCTTGGDIVFNAGDILAWKRDEAGTGVKVWKAGSGANFGDPDTPTKFTNSDASPSVAGRDTWQFADTPADITMFDDMADGETKYIEPPSTTAFRILTTGGLVTPSSQSLIVSPGDPTVRLRKRGGTIRVDMMGIPRRSEDYGAEPLTVSSNAISPSRRMFTIAGTGGAAATLNTITVANKFKPNEELTGLIDQLPGAAITIGVADNITTPNGLPYTFSARRVTALDHADSFTQRKEIFFRVNAAGTGVELLDRGFTEFERNNEPLGDSDDPMKFVAGQSNADTGVATTTGAALADVKTMTTGGLSWGDYDTTGAGPYLTNCHISQASRYAGPYDSFCKLWSANQTKTLYAALCSQGGERYSANTSGGSTANKSKWNPDNLINQADGSPDPATDGYYRARKLGEVTGTPKYSLNELLEDMIRSGIKARETALRRPRILGLDWIHGESDALESDTAGEYPRHLRKWYAGKCAAAGCKIPLFIVLMRSPAYTYGDIVREAQLSFARSEPLVQIIDPFDLPSYDGNPVTHYGIYESDDIHFNQDAADEIAQEIYNRTIAAGFYGVVSDPAARKARGYRWLFSAHYVPGGAYDSATQAAFVWNNINWDPLALYNTDGRSDDSIMLPWDGSYRITIRGLQSTVSGAASASELKIYLNGDPDANPSGDATYQQARVFMNKDSSGGQIQHATLINLQNYAAGDLIYGVYQGYLHTSSTTDKNNSITIEYLGEAA